MLHTYWADWKGGGGSVELLTGFPVILAEVFCGFPQFLQINAGIAPWTRPCQLINNCTDQVRISVTLETCIRKVSDKNFDWGTGCPCWDFSWFSSTSPAICLDSICKCVTAAYFQIIGNQSTLCSWERTGSHLRNYGRREGGRYPRHYTGS
jgi:hypothetical protein